MKEFLSQNYAFLGRNPKKTNPVADTALGFLKSRHLHFLLFGIIMCIVGYLAVKKMLPYSWSSAFATTFSYAIASVGFCLLMGYSGLASLGTGGFIGIGTYAVHYVMTEAGLPFFLALLIALAVAVVIGVIVGFISLRIEGIYLVILTLGLSEILRNLYVVLEDGTRVELALDAGVLTGGSHQQEFAEVEVELKEGSEESAVLFAKVLAAKFHLTPEPEAKVVRARKLAFL